MASFISTTKIGSFLVSQTIQQAHLYKAPRAVLGTVQTPFRLLKKQVPIAEVGHVISKVDRTHKKGPCLICSFTCKLLQVYALFKQQHKIKTISKELVPAHLPFCFPLTEYICFEHHGRVDKWIVKANGQRKLG